MEDELTFSEYVIAQEEVSEGFNDLNKILDKISMATTTKLSLEELANPSLETISEFIGYDVSLEASDLSIFKDRVGVLYDSLNSMIFMKFKTLSPLVSKTSAYRGKELSSLMEKISNGQLVPDSNIDPKKVEAFNRKLAVFYASGYNLDTGCSHLVTYLENISNLTARSGKYLNGLGDMFKKLNADTPELNVPKLSGILNVKNNLNGLIDNVERKVRLNDFRLSIIASWISSQVEMVMVSNSTRRGIRVHTDTFSVNFKKSITKANNADTLKLLDFGIKNGNKLDAVHKSLSFAIKGLARDNTMQLLKSAAGKGSTHRFLVAKYSEATIRSIIQLYQNVASFDSLIISYVNLTYRAAKAEDKVSTKDDKNSIKVDTTKK